MFKILLAITLVIQGIVCDSEVTTTDILLDHIGSQIIRVGDPENMFTEDENSLKATCEKYGGKTLTGEVEKVNSLLQGFLLKVFKVLIPKMLEQADKGCKDVKAGQGVKAARVGKAINKKVDQAQKLRFGLQAALAEMAKSEYKGSFSHLACHLRQFNEKIEALYSDNEETKVFIKDHNKLIWYPIIEMLESDPKGKEKVTCQLKEGTSNPTELHSIVAPLIKAIENLEKK